MKAGTLKIGPPPANAKDQVERIVNRMSAALAGKHPGVQGAALADLTATWLAGHEPPEVREDLLAMHVAAIRELIPHNVALIRQRRQ